MFYLFQSTLSVRRATSYKPQTLIVIDISIHALREESDIRNPTIQYKEVKFQSTLSVRRATWECDAQANTL